MNLSPIPRVLSILRRHRVRALLMGGQACILYGAAEFSRDVDVAVAVDARNLARLRSALADLNAVDRELRAEEDRERAADRRYWAPLRAELERLRLSRPRED